MEMSDLLERRRHGKHHHVRDRDPEQRADSCRYDVVGEPLVEEHLHEVAAARADARAIPSSLRRSAASITKIRKIRRMPAAIENDPNVVNIDMKAAPCSSASSSASCLLLSASRPRLATVGQQADTRRSRPRRRGSR